MNSIRCWDADAFLNSLSIGYFILYCIFFRFIFCLIGENNCNLLFFIIFKKIPHHVDKLESIEIFEYWFRHLTTYVFSQVSIGHEFMDGLTSTLKGQTIEKLYYYPQSNDSCADEGRLKFVITFYHFLYAFFQDGWIYEANKDCSNGFAEKYREWSLYP